MVRRRLPFERLVKKRPYARRVDVDSLRSTSSVICSNIDEIARNVGRMQEQLSQASIDNGQVISKLSFASGKLAGHLLRAREWQRELTNILEEEKDNEVRTICGPDIDDLLKNINAEKELAVQEAREDIKRCVICVSKEKNVTLIPCSHTFCDECVVKMRAAEGSKCAFCRQRIYGSFPIHLTE